MRSPRQQVPVEHQPVTAGPGRVLRRLRVVEDTIGDRFISGDSFQIVGVRYRNRLHHRLAETGADRRDALRRFLAVKLQKIGVYPRHDVANEGVVGIDQKRRNQSAAARLGGKIRAAQRGNGAGARRENTSPTRSARALNAASIAAKSLIPQILTSSMGVR